MHQRPPQYTFSVYGTSCMMNQRRDILPLSGYEPTYFEGAWATNAGVKSNNCYDYSIGDYSNKRTTKSVTGDRARAQGNKDLKNRYNQNYACCKDVLPGLLKDNPGKIYRESAEVACKPGYYKIMMFTGSSKDASDFHFYRQNGDIIYAIRPGDTIYTLAAFFSMRPRDIIRANNMNPQLVPGMMLYLPVRGLWSHKLGWATGPLLKDSCGKPICDPRKACRKHAVDYANYCGSFCVEAGRVRSGM